MSGRLAWISGRTLFAWATYVECPGVVFIWIGPWCRAIRYRSVRKTVRG